MLDVKINFFSILNHFAENKTKVVNKYCSVYQYCTIATKSNETLKLVNTVQVALEIFVIE